MTINADIRRLERPRPDMDIAAQMQIRRMPGESCMHLFRRLHDPLVSYYESWTYREPMAVTTVPLQNTAPGTK